MLMQTGWIQASRRIIQRVKVVLFIPRFYVQLPLPSAHEFHDDMAGKMPPLTVSQPVVIPDSAPIVAPTEPPEPPGSDKKCRLNPQVVQKIREIVAGGEVRVYHVRRLLR